MLNIGLYYQGTVSFILYCLVKKKSLTLFKKGWRGYKDYIGVKVLYPGFSNKLKEIVLNSDKVQDIINVLADRQTQLLADQKKWGKNDKRIEKQRKVLRKELQVVSKAIAEKAIATVDSLATFRFFAFLVNNVLVRLYHQGIHIRESEWIEVSINYI
jgi:energy-converting hydrogenase Eha subunit H